MTDATVFERAFYASSQPLMLIDGEGGLMAANQALREASGVDIEGRTRLVDLAGDRVDRALEDEIVRALAAGDRWRGAFWLRGSAGETPCFLAIDPIAGERLFVASFAFAVSGEGDIANFDDLTGLPNRALLLEHLEVGIAQARRQNSLLGLVLIDLDEFQQINLDYGFRIGDEVLKAVAQRLVSAARESDAVARIAGDKFAVMLSGPSDGESAEKAARRLVATLSEPIHVEDLELSLVMNLGLSLFPEHATSADRLLSSAADAMGRAKRSGGFGLAAKAKAA